MAMSIRSLTYRSIASILANIERARAAGKVTEVLVASHDADRLGGRLEDLASSGVTVTVLGFREKARYAAASARLGFVDLEEIPGIWNGALPRTDLFDLPEEGRELPPLAVPGAPPTMPAAAPAATMPAAAPAATLAGTTAVAAAPALPRNWMGRASAQRRILFS